MPSNNQRPTYKFEDKINDIFSTIESYHENPVAKSISFEVPGDTISFDKLTEVSQLLRTKHINLGSETRHGGWCETCDYEYGVVIVRISNVDFTDLEIL